MNHNQLHLFEMKQPTNTKRKMTSNLQKTNNCDSLKTIIENETTEQKNIKLTISKDTTKIFKIIAFAGTGKTTTLQLIANHFQEDKILYLAFNTGIKNEASKKFSNNVTVKTTHGLAYGYIKQRVPKINLNKLKNYKIAEIAKMFEVSFNNASEINAIFENWCNSSKLEITIKDEFEKTKIYAKQFAELMENGTIEPTHSFYLKKFQIMLRRGEITTKKYKLILLDEAQDTNDVTLDIFYCLNAEKRILVGDIHQSIYSFRGTKNQLLKLDGETMHLTQSFRFPTTIANDASRFLKLMKQEQNRIVSFKNYDHSLKCKTTAYISRTNGELVEAIARCIEEGKENSYYTVREPEEIFQLSIDIYHFIVNKFEKIHRNKYLLNFESEDHLRIYIEDTDDTELKTSLKLAKEYKENLIEFLNLAKINFMNKEQIKEPIIFTTAHAAKGLEWDRVILADDFYDLGSKIAGEGYRDIYEYYTDLQQGQVKQEITDEINLFYVAITRAKKYVDFFKCSAYDYVHMDVDEINRRISKAHAKKFN